MRKPRSHPFTLIELLVSFGLLAIILTLLQGSYWQLYRMQSGTEEIAQEQYALSRCQGRLQEVLGQTRLDKGRGYFYLEEPGAGSSWPSLVFTYDRGSDVDPQFSGLVLSRLYLDENHQLCLATWPLPEKEFQEPQGMLHEVLMQEVEKVQFVFYRPPDQARIRDDSGSLEEWEMKRAELPALLWLKLTLSQENEESLGFLLPHSKRHVRYFL